jgi:hypothetical protein
LANFTKKVDLGAGVLNFDTPGQNKVRGFLQIICDWRKTQSRLPFLGEDRAKRACRNYPDGNQLE